MKEKPKSFNNKTCLIIKIRIWRFVALQLIDVYVNEWKKYALKSKYYNCVLKATCI